jgi:hypothetical protein
MIGCRDYGMNYSEIGDKLNALGIATKMGKQWFPQQVSNVLSRDGGGSHGKIKRKLAASGGD